jgi:hypothetical protein
MGWNNGLAGGVYLVRGGESVPGTNCLVCTRYIDIELYLVQEVVFVPGTVLEWRCQAQSDGLVPSVVNRLRFI